MLLVEFNKLIPSTYRVNVEIRPHYNEAIDYMRRVKEETKDQPLVYTEFIRVLKLYREKQMSIEEVNNSVRSIMVEYPALIESFKAFLPNYYENSSSEEEDDYEPITSKPIKKRNISPTNISVEKMVVETISEPINKNEVIFFKRLKKIMEINSQPGSDYFLELIKAFELYCDSVITRFELAGMIEPLFKLSNFVNFLTASSHSLRRMPKEENREVITFIQTQLTECFEVFKAIIASRESSRRKHGWFFRPLSDFDTTKSKRHGHSYLEIQRPRILKAEPQPEINGLWVSVPYGSEDFSFRHFRKNIFEDALFKCEDERFELDMATENACYTLRLLEKALEEANLLTPEQQKTFALDEKIFSKLRLRPIISIYSEHAAKIIEMLRNSPIKSLPVVISRIKLKIETWKKNSKFESERIWKETMDKNFFKSLDHRSFYFKQNEKKMTNSKAFLLEAKQRYQCKAESKQQMRRYLRNEMNPLNFEFMGGSRNTLFFNSFAGLSAGVSHKVPESFVDETVEEFKSLDSQDKKVLYLNAPEYSTLPHYRLLFTCQPILFDSIRLILYALEKSNLSDKAKVDKWMQGLFQDFLGIRLPPDILNHKVEEFFENITSDEVSEQDKPQANVEYTRKIINRWIHTESYNDMDIDENSFSEIVQDPMNLKKDQRFVGYLPLLKDYQVMYAPSTVFYFLRFFYDIYERLLKVKQIFAQTGQEEDYTKLQYGQYRFEEAVEGEYLGFLKVVCMLLRNTYDAARFEDKCRSLLGNDSYVFFTFDKLVNSAAKALHNVANEECTAKAAALYSKFSKNKLNEEMYLAEFLGLTPNSQIFRMHWNERFSVLSVTYIESPYDKLAEQAVKNAQKYRKHFLGNTQSCVVEEIKPLQYRMELYLKQNELSEEDYAKQVVYYHNIMHGMVENSYKLHYITGGEDFLINTRYYSNHILLENENESFICQDKNSLYQKLSEYSEKKFKVFRDSWIYNQ